MAGRVFGERAKRGYLQTGSPTVGENHQSAADNIALNFGLTLEKRRNCAIF
jgi:hypothetical protein